MPIIYDRIDEIGYDSNKWNTRPLTDSFTYPSQKKLRDIDINGKNLNEQEANDLLEMIADVYKNKQNNKSLDKLWTELLVLSKLMSKNPSLYKDLEFK